MWDPTCGHPLLDVEWVEADVFSDFEVRHAPLGDQAPDEPLCDPESIRERGDVDQPVVAGLREFALGDIHRSHGTDRLKPTASAIYSIISSPISHSSHMATLSAQVSPFDAHPRLIVLTFSDVEARPRRVVVRVSARPPFVGGRHPRSARREELVDTLVAEFLC